MSNIAFLLFAAAISSNRSTIDRRFVHSSGELARSSGGIVGLTANTQGRTQLLERLTKALLYRTPENK
jgi:hypothetical protein